MRTATVLVVLAVLAVALAAASNGNRRLLRGAGLVGIPAPGPSGLPALWATPAVVQGAPAGPGSSQPARRRRTRRLLVSRGRNAAAHVAPGAVGAPPYRPAQHAAPLPDIAPAPAPTDGLPDVILPKSLNDASAMLRSFFSLHEPQTGAGGKDWHKELALGILDIIDAVESPPAIWWPIHDALEGFSDKVEEVLNDISPSLASTVKFHEPEFVKVEGHSVEWHNHLVGLGGTGLSVNPCLVRLGAVGAVAAPTAINIAPAAIAVGATGVDADPSVISIGPKLIFVGPTGGPGMPSHLAFTPVLINVSPTWEIAPPGAGVPPIPQAGGVKVDPTPGHMVVTPPVDPGAGARDRAAVAEAAAVRAAGAP